MSVVLETGVMYYRENEQDTWHPLILKAETDFSALIDPYDPTATKTWVVGEYCLYDDRFRRCIAQTSTPGAFDPTKWVETTIGDELEAVKNTLTKLEVLVVTIPTSVTIGTTYTSTQVAAIADVEDDMVVLQSVLGTPSAQTADWTVTTGTGSITITSTQTGTASTSLTLYLMKSR